MRNRRRKDAREIGVPPGTVVSYAGNAAAFVPEGWLLCDGTNYRKDKYQRLFKAIGYTWGGSGDTFSTPDFRSRFLVGVGTFASLAQTETAGEAVRNPQHSHAAGSLDADDHAFEDDAALTGAGRRVRTEGHTVTGTTGAAGGGSDFPHAGVYLLIKA